MNDDLDRWLRNARPATAADDGWAGSAAADEALDRIAATVATTPRPSGLWARRLRTAAAGARPHPYRVAATAFTLAAVVAGSVALALGSGGGGAHGGGTPPVLGAPPPNPAIAGPRPQEMALASYTSCAAMRDDLRTQTAAHVTADGLPGGPAVATNNLALGDKAAPLPSSAPQEPTAGGNSTTNDQEIGVDEPDLVKTDGSRVVSVSGGVLRVVDAASHKVTGRLDLTTYAGAGEAQLFVAGNRALVLLAGGGSTPIDPGGVVGDYAGPGETANTYLLVDLTSQPRVLGTLHPKGGYVDARMVGGTVRLVVDSAPAIRFPVLPHRTSTTQQTAANRAVVRRAPLSAWLPSYDVTSGGASSTHSVPCQDVSHPASYTGTSMLTVYSIDLAKGFGDVAPVSIAADGETVYGTTSSLYVASSAAGKHPGTQLHRFDITRPGRPTYLGSGTVPGTLLNSYSLSDYAGHLRVATTPSDGSRRASSAVYVLDARTLKITGHVGGLGRGEEIYAVRFLGPLGYVVTYRSVDPLYVLDLHDPAHPAEAGAVTLSGYSAYLHPTGGGRLLGVGGSVGRYNEPDALQVSLFDVSTPTAPRRIDRVLRHGWPQGQDFDPHAFLYWAPTRTAVIPLQNWTAGGQVLVVHVGPDQLRTVGIIRNPASTDDDGGGIERSLIVGGDIWTMSADGLAVSDPATLHRTAWIAFD